MKRSIKFLWALLVITVVHLACNNEQNGLTNTDQPSFDKPDHEIDIQRLTKNFDSLKLFGDPEIKGNERIAFSQYNIEALNWIKTRLRGLGLSVSVDFAGNLIARRAGRDSTLAPIGFGSHIDCVPNGGHYDGQVGVLGSMEVLEYLEEHKIETNHPLEFIIFSNEEGGVFGSRALAGVIEEETLNVATASGYTNGEGINRLGGDRDRVFEVKRNKGAFHAFLELHIEQGAILEEEKLDIGVVQGIVGLRWWDVEINGFSNHAGTTPMNRRQDAMLAAAEFTLAVNEIVKSIPGSHVGTVGRIKASPGVPNVIPGKVVLSLELRDLSNDMLEKLFERIQKRSESIAQEYGTSFKFDRISATGDPALTAMEIQDLIEQLSTAFGYRSKRMPSGAGHDAQEMALLGPAGMIFIPSKGGISHSPEEYSTFEQMAKGTNILLNSILDLDKMETIRD